MRWRSEAKRMIAAARVLVLVAAGGFPAGLTAQETRFPSARDFVNLSEIIDAQVAPRGDRVAYVVREAPDSSLPRARARPAVWVVPVAGDTAARRLTVEGNADSPQWHPDSRVLAFLADDENGRRQIFLLDPEVGAAEQLSRHGTSITRFAWSPTGDAIAFIAPAMPDSATERLRRAGFDAVVADEQTEAAQLWHLKAADRTTRPLFADGRNVRAVTWAPRGDRLAVVVGAAEGASLIVIDTAGDQQHTLTDRAGGVLTRRQILDWSPDGSTLLFAFTAPQGSVGHWIGLVPADGGPVRESFRDYEGTIMRAVWLADSRHILAQAFQDLTSRILRIDTRDGRTTEIAEVLASYPRLSATRDAKVIAYAGQAVDRPADVWVLENGRTARRVTDLNPHLSAVRLGSVRAFTWHNPQDGVQVGGVLVTPPDYTGDRPYPTVIHLHGGPHFHWGIGWLGDWHDWAQLLAARGYVVLLPNPRGSTGRGWAFAGAVVNDLGGVDVSDVLAGVDALVDAGIADPDRLGVGGFSYGGFLTAATITQSRRFRAAVVAAGITNFFSFALSPGLGRGWSTSFFPDNVLAAPAAYERRSPLAHIEKVTTPTLLLHGEQDNRIGVGQAWEFYNALRLLGVRTRLVVYPRAGHGISERAHQIDYLERIADWFDRHLTNYREDE